MRTLKIALLGSLLALPLAAQQRAATAPPVRKPTPTPHAQDLARKKAEHALLEKIQAQLVEKEVEQQAHLQLFEKIQVEQALQHVQKPTPRALQEVEWEAAKRAWTAHSDWWYLTEEERAAELTRQLDRLARNGPRESWAQQDPADSLWRAARSRFNRGEFNDAMRLFTRIRTEERYARSTYRPDAYYYEAFSLSRMGSEDNLRQAQHILSELIRQYPAPQRHTDTNSLLTTIQARLAQSYGNLPAAAQVRQLADEVRYATTAMPTVVTNAANLVEAVNVWPTTVTVAGQYTPFFSSALQRNPQCANEAEIRLIALNALVRMDSTAAMPVLREVMARRDECAPVLRERALMIVARIKSPEAETMLFDAARSDPDLNIRQTALVWLSTNNPDRAISIAEERLRGSQTTSEQEWALEALARMRNERAWRAIREYATRSELSVEARRRAILQLSQSRDSANASFLRDLYGRVSGDRELKEAILMSSAGRRGTVDANWLMGIALNDAEDLRLREYALNLVSRSTSVSTDRFSTLYDRATERRLKSAALRALSERARSDAVATEKLIAIARNETDIELRKGAVTALASVNDPRARELLMEILRR